MKTRLSAIISGILVLCMLLPCAALAADSYSDVQTEAWSRAVESGLVISYPNGTLLPEAHLTRAEFAVLLDRYVSIIK